MNEADGLPSTICTECIKLVKQLYLFKQQVEMADNMLKNYYREVKTEEPICIQVTDENNPLGTVRKKIWIVNVILNVHIFFRV